MASQGPNYPGTATSVVSGDANEVVWSNADLVRADDGNEASITHATFDSPDPSEWLYARGFGFTIPAGATIDGIVVEVDRRSINTNGGVDKLVHLANASGVVTGTDHHSATVWPTTLTIQTYGSSSDTWSASPTVAMVNDPDFGVYFQARANIANADIAVDFIRMTVYYTAGATEHQISVPDDLGLSIVTALTRETFISAPATPLSDIATSLIRETFISADVPVGPTIATNLDRELLLAAAFDLGPVIDSALTRETFLSIPDDLGLSIATALARETFLSIPDDLGLVIASDLTVSGGATEHQISAAMPLGLVIDSALARETFISVPDDLGLSIVSNLTRELLLSATTDLGLQIATALVRETFLSAAAAYGPDVASALIRETFIGIPDDLGLLLYTNLRLTTPGGGGTSLSRMLLGAG